ncbi:MAG: DUF433 domain-containing protein [Ignavibacteriae bacterium]|nr:DUF433 domain-containing protein [Ignavibacteriota bacterium]
MNWREHIHSDKSVLLGKPTIKGTRLSVEFLLQLFASGWTEQQILENYPRLTKEDLQALFAYSYECLQDGLMVESPRKAV